MSHKNGHLAEQAFKALLTTTFKLLAIALSFTCRVVALLLTKISELFDKATGHDSNH